MDRSHHSRQKSRGQSFVELAIVLPVLLFLLVGFVEVGAIVYDYLSLLDVAREAARFAADRDPEVLNGDMSSYPTSACEDDALHYYLDTACVIIGSGFNPDISLDSSRDDVAISIFTIDNNTVVRRRPEDGDGVWSLYADNWTKNCDGTLRSTTPFFPLTVGDAWINVPPPTAGAGTPTPTPGGVGGPTDKGVVLVEIYFCHDQLLNLPLLGDLIPNPVPLHAYAVMPAPEAAPTPTPLP